MRTPSTAISTAKSVLREPELLGSLEREGAARRITEALLPHEDDYFVLKPKHSAFFATPLELLLQQLAAQRLVLTGITAGQCVMSTAIDAKMRDYEVIVPTDCVAAQTAQRRTRAVQHLSDVLRLQTVDSGELALPHHEPAQCTPRAQPGRAKS